MTAELERLKTTCLAQEAEIARLQAGFDELKQWAIKTINIESSDQFDAGVDITCESLIDKINRITGETK